MENTYKTSSNYFNTKNRNIPLTKKTSYAVLKTDPSYYNQDFSRNSLMNSSMNENFDNAFSKILSKKKKRGILDISSPGNKDVLTDSDSETQTTKNTKYLGNVNIKNKSKCAKLIIEKVESQTPQNNEEYYKFTNKKRISKDSGNFRYNNNMVKRLNSPLNDKNTNSSNNNNFQYNNNRKIITQSRGFTNPKVSRNPIKSTGNFDINNSNNDLNLTYYRKINSTVIARDSSTKYKNIYNYTNQNNLGKSTNISNQQNNNRINYQRKKSPLIYRSTESSIDKKNNSMNFVGNRANNNKKPNITDNELITPTISSLNNEDYSYPNKISKGLKKNIFTNNRLQTTISLYDYKDSGKKQTISQLINLKYNTNTPKTYLQTKFNDKLVKNVIKIQSFWRGAFIRELMSFVGKLTKFIEILENLFLNHKKKNFLFLLNSLNNFDKPKKKIISVGKNIKGPSLRQKYIFNNEKKEKPYQIKPKKNEEEENIENNFVKINNQIKPKKREEEEEKIKNNNNDIKNEDNKYNNLLKDYNSLMENYNKLKEEMEKMNKVKEEMDKKNKLKEEIDRKKKLKEEIDKKNKVKEEIDKKNKILKFENLDYDKNELEIIDKKKKNDKKDEININKKFKEDKNKIINKGDNKIKKFDIIEPGTKDEFKIIQKNNDFNKLRYRARRANKNKIEKIEKVSEIKYESKIDKDKNKNKNKNITYDDYLNHFISNINISNKEEFIIEEIPNINKKILNLIPFDISNNSLTLINNNKNKKSKDKEKNIPKEENLNINKSINKIQYKISNNNFALINDNKNIKSKQKEKDNSEEEKLNINRTINKIPFEISNNSLNLINDNKNIKSKDKENKNEIKEKSDIKMNLMPKPFYISNNCLSIINKKKDKDIKNIFKEKSVTRKIFEYLSINKNKENDLSIIILEKEKKKKSKEKENKEKPELIVENQINLNTEIKGFETKKLKIFEECIVNEHNINIIQIRKKKEFDIEQMNTKNDISLYIINESKPQKDLDNKNGINVNKAFNNESLAFNENINLSILGNIKANIIDNKKDNEIKIDELIEEKKDDINLGEEKNKNKKFDEKLMIDNNNILYIKRKKKKKIDKLDKMTEITKQLNENELKPNNHYELFFEGKTTLNEIIEYTKIEQKEENINKKSKKKSKKGKKEKEKKEICLEPEEKISQDKSTKNYNEGNIVQKVYEIQMNPIELYKSNSENKIEDSDNQKEEFTEKAKSTMMKIILPIRLKTVLRKYVRKNVCTFLIKCME